MKPFAIAGLGYTFEAVSAGPGSDTNDSGLWNLGVGVEIPAGPLVFTPKITVRDYFKGNENREVRDGVGASRWFRAGASVYAEVAKIDLQGNAPTVWAYDLGLRFKF
ncbi:MAG: hypothetical protein HY302_05345 [Opitutae bacterium]|nr:hypothetical protein [Opitutae bacterium]